MALRARLERLAVRVALILVLAAGALGLEARLHVVSAQTPTNITVTSSPNPSAFGQSVTFTATVSSVAGPSDGLIAFKDGATTLGTVLSSGGVAMFTTSTLAAGTHSITASFPGNSDFAASTSVVLIQTVNTDIGERTAAIIANFLARRADLITSDAGRPRLLDRLQPSAGVPGTTSTASAAPTQLGGGTGEQVGRMAFATSLSQLRAAAAQGEAARRAGLGMGPTANAVPDLRLARPGFDVWAEGAYTSFDYDAAGDRSSGHFGLFKLGADYLLNPNLLVGALVQFDRMADTSGPLGYKIEGAGWMAGPYAEIRISNHLIVDVKALWGTSDNSVSPSLAHVDSFDTSRWLVSTGLTGSWVMGPWHFSPRAQILGFHDEQKAYTNSLGVLIPEQSVAMGRVIGGPEVSYRYYAPSGALIEPRLGVKGLWTFGQHGDHIPGAGQQDPIDTVRARLEVGLKLQARLGTRLELSGSYDGLGESNLTATTGKVQLTMPFN